MTSTFRRALIPLFCCALLVAAACGDDTEPVDGGTTDTGAMDAAGMDASLDAGMDASLDAGMDAGIDASTDTGTDGGENTPPVADAGPSQHSLLHRRVVLSGSASDPDGDAASFLWSQTAGPNVALDDPTLAMPSFRAWNVGVYVFELVASDGMASSETSSTTVYIHDIDGGEDHTLALKPDGTLWAWGGNYDGSLGTSTTAAASNIPVRVCNSGATDCDADPLTGVVAISTSRNASFALASNGTVWSWGSNYDGELGNGTYEIRRDPGPVCASSANADCAAAPLDDVVQISAGYLFAAALKSDGTVWTWGYNGNGELGNDRSEASPYPVQVCAPGETDPCTSFLSNIVFIAAGGGGHTLALDASGNLWGWGHNKNGQVGNGDSGQAGVYVPVQVCAANDVAPCASFLANIIDFDVWSGHSLALDEAGTLWAWGSNDQGELGLVTTDVCSSGGSCTETPEPVCESLDSPCTSPLSGVVDFAPGRRFSAAVLDDETMRAWGDNSFGQLGDGTFTSTTSLVQPCAVGQSAPCTTPLGNIAAVATGSFHVLALETNGGLVAWGDNYYGQLGDGGYEDQGVPVRVSGY